MDVGSILVMAQLSNCMGIRFNVVNIFFRSQTMVTKALKYFKWIFHIKEKELLPLRNITFTFVKLGEWGILIERVK